MLNLALGEGSNKVMLDEFFVNSGLLCHQVGVTLTATNCAMVNTFCFVSDSVVLISAA